MKKRQIEWSAPGDRAGAVLAAIFGGMGFGLLTTPVFLFAPILALLVLPVAIVVTILATPVALFCIRRGIANYITATLAGAALGGLSGVFGMWVADCINGGWVQRCSDHPNPARRPGRISGCSVSTGISGC